MTAWSFGVRELDVITLTPGVGITVEVRDGGLGRAGEDGDDGADAYDIAVAEGFVGDRTAWLASLRGADGEDGVGSVVDPLVLTGDVLSLTVGPGGVADHDETALALDGKVSDDALADALLALTAASVGADPTGTAAGLVAAHAALPDAHPGYVDDDELAAALAAQSATDRDRANHSGQQTAATISDFTEAVQDAVAALLGAGSNVTLLYDDAADTLTVSATGGGSSGLDAEAVRDAIGVALVGVGNIAVAVNDEADTITVSTTATANSTDAQLRDRTTHTGEQAIATVTGLQAALDAKVPTSRTITAGTGLTGGGTLAADRTLAVSYGTTAGTAAQGNDARLSDARTPTAHAASHASGASDPVTLAQSQVSGLTADLSGKAPSAAGVPTGGTDGQVLTKTSGADYATAWETPAAGGGSTALALAASNPGTSLTGWNLEGATWSLNTNLQVVTNSNSWRTARLDSAVIDPAQDWAFEGDVELQADMSGSGDYVALGFLTPTGSIATAASRVMAVLQGRTSLVLYQPSGITTIATIPALADGWHTLGVIVRTGAGNSIAAFYIDDVEVTRASVVWSATSYRLGCGAYGACTARFRNFRAWNIPDTRDYTFPA